MSSQKAKERGGKGEEKIILFNSFLFTDQLWCRGAPGNLWKFYMRSWSSVPKLTGSLICKKLLGIAGSTFSVWIVLVHLLVKSWPSLLPRDNQPPKTKPMKVSMLHTCESAGEGAEEHCF